jgi:hypothetical protein
MRADEQQLRAAWFYDAKDWIEFHRTWFGRLLSQRMHKYFPAKWLGYWRLNR